MKNISVLVLLVSIAAIFAVAGFLVKQESQYTARSYANARPPSNVAAELRKTEAALQRIEHMQLAGNFSFDADGLLPARHAAVTLRSADAENGNVFPVAGDEKQNKTARSDINRLAEALSSQIAQQDYIGSGYAAPVAVESPVKKEEKLIQTKPIVDTAVQDLYQVSFIYVSPDIRRAIINGDFVQEGELLGDGSRVTMIDNTAVVITKNKKEYSLHVPKLLSAYSGTGEK
jgi:hypothetical protein